MAISFGIFPGILTVIASVACGHWTLSSLPGNKGVAH